MYRCVLYVYAYTCRCIIDLALHISTGTCNNEILDFAKFDDVSLAFLALFSRSQDEVKRYENFVIIKFVCVAHANQKLSKEIKRTQDSNSLFQLFADNKAHCN